MYTICRLLVFHFDLQIDWQVDTTNVVQGWHWQRPCSRETCTVVVVAGALLQCCILRSDRLCTQRSLHIAKSKWQSTQSRLGHRYASNIASPNVLHMQCASSKRTVPPIDQACLGAHVGSPSVGHNTTVIESRKLSAGIMPVWCNQEGSTR